MSNFPEPDDFSQLLEKLRTTRGISKKALAHDTQVTPGYISLLTTGERKAPSADKVALLAKALQLNAEERRRFFQAAGYSYSLSLSDAESFYESHLYEAGKSASSLEEDRSGIPKGQVFYGRGKELAQLRQWIVGDHDSSCQLVALVGLGGVGKTSLAIKAAQKIKQEFEYVRWYSLENALPKDTILKILGECLEFFPETWHTEGSEDVESKLDLFLTCLEKHRCLIILDNFESVLRGEHLVGQYVDGYEEYGKLLRLVGAQPQRSCLLLTSREKPEEVAQLEGTTVKSLLLSGMDGADGRNILRDKGLLVEDEAWMRLVQLYSGNPFALQLISTPIRDVFGGSIAAFLRSLREEDEDSLGEEGAMVISVVHSTLDKQFQRLSAIEKEVMYWLAIERETVSFQELRDDILLAASKLRLFDALESLLRRSLIERRNMANFGLQPIVMKYMTDQLVGQAYTEINTQQFTILESHALMKAQTRDYVRKSQLHFILDPLIERLHATLEQEEIEKRLKDLLALLHKSQKLGYTAGNILNLMIRLKCKLQGSDFSSLTVRQAYLRDDGLPAVNFSRANLFQSVFADTFGCVLSVTLSPDGSLLVAGTVNGEVRIWERENSTLLHTFAGHTDWVRSVAFSANGKILASGSHDQTIRLWNVQTGQGIGLLTGLHSRVRAVAFSPLEEEPLLASASDDRMIRIWNVGTHQCLLELSGHDGYVNSIAFSPDGQTLASVSHDGTIRLWDVHMGYQLKELGKRNIWIWSVAISPDGQTLACGDEEGTISLWNINAGQCFQTFTGHHSRVNTVAFNPVGDRLVSGSDDETVRLWNTHTSSSEVFTGHKSGVRSVAFSPDSTSIISGSDDETVRIWEVSTRQCRNTLQGYSGWIHSAVFNPDTTLLVSGGEDTRVRIWDAKKGTRVDSLHGHTHRVRTVSCSPDKRKIASGSDDQSIRIWDVDTGRYLITLHGHKHRVRSVAFSSDSTKIISGSDDQTVRIWEANTGMCLYILTGHSSRVYSAISSIDGRLLASCSEDKTIRLYDLSTRECLNVFQGHEGRVYSIAFSPDGTLLLSGGDDLTLRLWEVSTGKCIRIMEGHKSRICSVAYRPDGQVIASGSDDRTVGLWNANTGEALYTLSGHSGRVCSVSFSSDSKLLTSSSYDGTIRIWDTQTYQPVGSPLRSNRPYEHMNITDVRGLTPAQKAMLRYLGAVDK